MFKDLSINILVSIITFISGFIFTKVYNFYQYQKPIKRQWQLSDRDKEKVCIITADTPEEYRFDASEYAVIGYITEFMGADIMATHIRKIYKNIDYEIDMACFAKPSDIEYNVILIGGPNHNPYSRKLLDEFNDRLDYYFDGFDLVNKNDSYERYRSNIIQGQIELDYCLVINAKSPYNDNKRIILVAGCRTLGCLAGSRFLTEKIPKKDRSGNAIKIKNGSDFAFIIKTRGYQYRVFGRPEVEKFVLLKS